VWCYLPVAVLDDDPSKGRLRLEGDVAASLGANTLAIAIPSADAALVRDLSDLADEAGLDVLILPPVSEMFGSRTSTGDLRDLDLGD